MSPRSSAPAILSDEDTEVNAGATIPGFAASTQFEHSIA
jgi:hypothetical protein